MSKDWIVKSNEPRPPWWHPRKRRAYDEHLAAATRFINALKDEALEAQIRRSVIDTTLYGFSVFPVRRRQDEA